MCILFKEGENLKDVAIIIPYFGKLPSNLITFLNSCRINKRIDWFIFTDQSLADFSIPKNVHIIQKTFNAIKKEVKEVVDFDELVLDKPYKLCDYKPAYGLIFRKYILGFKYWGYSDLDVVYGNLWKFIKNGIVNGYDRIGTLGHLSLFKNEREVNNRYKLPVIKNGEETYLYRWAFSTSKACHFDETWGINIIYNHYGFSTYKNKDLVNEAFPENMDLSSIDRRYFRLPQIYIYSKGQCLFFYREKGEIYKSEFGYFHFQKRLFSRYIHKECNSFYVDNSGYHELKTINNNIISELVDKRSTFRKRLLYMGHAYFRTNWFTDRKIFNYYLPVKHIYNRIFKERDFFI